MGRPVDDSGHGGSEPEGARMTDEIDDDHTLAAGDFDVWITQMHDAIRHERESTVPCNGCTACCRSSQFVHIGPEETDALALIPPELLFPAPRLPRGHVLLGYDERGHCPMLVDDRCSIYAHRPNACRTYDCRIFPAAGVGIDDDTPVARRARCWRFDHRGDEDRTTHAVVRAAARFFEEHPDVLPDGAAPGNATHLALLALQHHDVFRQRDTRTGRMTVADPNPEEVRVELRRRARR
jgi:uncharacterized protein